MLGEFNGAGRSYIRSHFGRFVYVWSLHAMSAGETSPCLVTEPGQRAKPPRCKYGYTLHPVIGCHSLPKMEIHVCSNLLCADAIQFMYQIEFHKFYFGYKDRVYIRADIGLFINISNLIST